MIERLALVRHSQHCFVELLLGCEEHALTRALLMLVLLGRRELSYQLPARGALHDDDGLVLDRRWLRPGHEDITFDII